MHCRCCHFDEILVTSGGLHWNMTNSSSQLTEILSKWLHFRFTRDENFVKKKIPFQCMSEMCICLPLHRYRLQSWGAALDRHRSTVFQQTPRPGGRTFRLWNVHCSFRRTSFIQSVFIFIRMAGRFFIARRNVFARRCAIRCLSSSTDEKAY